MHSARTGLNDYGISANNRETTSKPAGPCVQLKRELAGLTFDEQMERLKPPAPLGDLNRNVEHEPAEPGPKTTHLQKRPEVQPVPPTAVVQLASEDELSPGRRVQKGRRGVITFIMGSRGTFYTNAAIYWRGKCDLLVTHIRTFNGILAHLHRIRSHGGKPWADINIVVHGDTIDANRGIKIPLSQNSRRRGEGDLDPKELKKAIDTRKNVRSNRRSIRQELPNTKVDKQTKVTVHGCGVGQSSAMLKQLSRAFGGDDKEAPTVYAPTGVISYGQVGGSGPCLETLSDYWNHTHPAAETGKWNIAKVATWFQKQHPGETTYDGKPFNWKKAVKTAWNEKKVNTYDWKLNGTAKYTGIPKSSKDKRGHARLIANYQPLMKGWGIADWREAQDILAGKKPDWKCTQIQQTRTPNGQSDRYDFSYRFEKNNSTQFKTRRFSLINPANLPQNNTKSVKEAWLKTRLPAHIFSQYSWNIVLKGTTPSQTTPGVSYQLNALAKGKRVVVRVERMVKDQAGKPSRPGRTSSKHYGSHTP